MLSDCTVADQLPGGPSVGGEFQLDRIEQRRVPDDLGRSAGVEYLTAVGRLKGHEWIGQQQFDIALVHRCTVRPLAGNRDSIKPREHIAPGDLHRQRVGVAVQGISRREANGEAVRRIGFCGEGYTVIVEFDRRHRHHHFQAVAKGSGIADGRYQHGKIREIGGITAKIAVAEIAPHRHRSNIV